MDERLSCDFLVVGGGGAGLMAALHAYDANPCLRVVLAGKGLVGKSGCTRMVHGLNAVLDPRDSVDLHFRDTIQAGQFINDQELAWELVANAPRTVAELETKVGCFLDRAADGRIAQSRFVPQSFDRTVTRGARLGVELLGRLHDQLFARQITVLDEHRAVELIHDPAGQRVAGALLLDVRTGRFVLVRARVVLLATGGGANMYRYSDASLEKSGDGCALAYRAGCELADMEMIQFMPMGLVAGRSRLHNLLLEERLRYMGGRLTNGRGERFMARYDPTQMEQASLDVVARAIYLEMAEGRGTPEGGVRLDLSHLGAELLGRELPEVVHACAERGYDLTSEPVGVAPLVHYQVGGVGIDTRCGTTVEGLLVAGEDAGGVHGAGRLGGNTSAESTTFGARAGDVAAELSAETDLQPVDAAEARQAAARASEPLTRQDGEDPFALHHALQQVMWERVGVVRDAAGLRRSLEELGELEARAENVRAAGGRHWNPAWQAALNVRNLTLLGRLVATAALYREESRGAHYRRDFPESDDERWLVNVRQARSTHGERVWDTPARMSRLLPPALVGRR